LDSLGAEVVPLSGDLLHLTCRDFSGFQQKQLAYAAAWALERHQKGKKTSMAARVRAAITAALAAETAMAAVIAAATSRQQDLLRPVRSAMDL
jgi:hypothetical protein